MKIIAIISMTLSSFLFAFSAHAEPRSVDALTLDVAGIKTGMGYQEAREAAAKHFKISTNAIKPNALLRTNIITNTKLPEYFSYESNGAKLWAHFETRVPPDKKDPLVVNLVVYELPVTEKNFDQMAKAAISKYGPPSSRIGAVGMSWCVSSGKGCNKDGEASLRLTSDSRLTLSDPAWASVRIQYMKDQKTTAPNF